MPKISIDVHQNDESVEVSFTKKTSPKKTKNIFYFKPIGIKFMTDPQSIDSLDTISMFNKGELKLLNIVNKEFIPKNLQIYIIKKKFTAPTQRILTSAINSWIKKGLLKRIQKEKYMISPYFFTPLPSEQGIIYDVWKSLK